MINHISIKIYGQVQRVGFRYQAKQLADSLNIKGFAQNLDDGSVEIEAEGENENLEKLVEWCKKGPAFSMIERVEIKQSKSQNFTEFSILPEAI